MFIMRRPSYSYDYVLLLSQLAQSRHELTPFGRQLRSDLYKKLHALKDPKMAKPSPFSLGVPRDMLPKHATQTKLFD